MAKSIANVSITTDTFAGWVSKTNILLHELSTEIVTVSDGTSGSNTTGNGSVIGILAANTIGTFNVRGGGVGNTANIATLTVGYSNSTTTSNVVVTGYAANINSNTLTITSNTSIGSGSQNVYISVANTTLSTNTLSITTTSNTNLTTPTLAVSGDLTLNNYVSFNSKVMLLAKTTSIDFPDAVTSNTVDTFSITEFTGAKYTINITDDSNANNKAFTEISVIYGFSNAHMTEYGTIYSNTQFVTFNTSANASHVILSANSSLANATFRIYRTTFV